MFAVPLTYSIQALATATIYCIWQKYKVIQETRRKSTVRERVTYMLWAMANRAD